MKVIIYGLVFYGLFVMFLHFYFKMKVQRFESIKALPESIDRDQASAIYGTTEVFAQRTTDNQYILIVMRNSIDFLLPGRSVAGLFLIMAANSLNKKIDKDENVICLCH